MILTIFVVFISFVGLIIIHEFGHFILAKKFGIEVEEFGIGFPPRLLGKKIGETIYSINLLPLGGFVKIHGEDGGVEDYRSFTGKPMWQRYLIILGGVAAFWVTAAVILTIVAGGWGMPVRIADGTELNGRFINPKIQITKIYSDVSSIDLDIKKGDIIADFYKVEDFRRFIKDNQDKEVSLNIEKGREVLERKVLATSTVRIFDVYSGTPAEASGLMREDIILGFETIKDFQKFIKENQYQKITLNLKRGNKEPEEKEILIEESLGVALDEELAGFSLNRIATETYPWYLAPLGGIETTFHYTASVAYGWVLMIGHALDLSELPAEIEEEDMSVRGPVGIFVTMGEFFQIGTDAFLRLIALIAIALAMINILPIPALDGGRIFFLTVEAIRGKPMNYKIEQKINTVFFILLIGLMIFITIRFDIPTVFSG